MENVPTAWGRIVTWKQSEDRTYWVSSEDDTLTNEEYELRRESMKKTWVKYYDNDGKEVKIV